MTGVRIGIVGLLFVILAACWGPPPSFYHSKNGLKHQGQIHQCNSYDGFTFPPC